MEIPGISSYSLTIPSYPDFCFGLPKMSYPGTFTSPFLLKMSHKSSNFRVSSGREGTTNPPPYFSWVKPVGDVQACARVCVCVCLECAPESQPFKDTSMLVCTTILFLSHYHLIFPEGRGQKATCPKWLVEMSIMASHPRAWALHS